jgi:hypothetical protein
MEEPRVFLVPCGPICTVLKPYYHGVWYKTSKVSPFSQNNNERISDGMSSSHREFFKLAVEECKASEALDFKFVFKGSLEVAYKINEDLTEAKVKKETVDKKRVKEDGNKRGRISVAKRLNVENNEIKEGNSQSDSNNIKININPKRKRTKYSPDTKADIKASKLSEEVIRSVPLHIAMQSKRGGGHIKTSDSPSTSTVSDLGTESKEREAIIDPDLIYLGNNNVKAEVVKEVISELVNTVLDTPHVQEQEICMNVLSPLHEQVHELLCAESGETEGTFIAISNIFNDTFEHLHSLIPSSFREMKKTRRTLGSDEACFTEHLRKQINPIQNKRRHNA